MTSVRHAEQDRALWAHRTVEELNKGRNDKERKELRSHIRQLPSHIQTSGLAQTLLFYAKKHGELEKRLRQQLALKGSTSAEAVADLVKDASNFRLKTREALACAQWLKRFAEVPLESR